MKLIYIFIICIICIFIIIFLQNKKINTFQNSESNDRYNKFKILEDNYKMILDEIPPFDITKITIERKRNEWNNEEGAMFLDKMNNNIEWVGSWDPSKKWFNFPLMYYNKVIGSAETICPNTIKILKQIGDINIAGFSLLLPTASLIRHTDTTGPNYDSMALNYFLVGDKSNLYVKFNKKYNTYTHERGKLVIFNSENEHYADNMGTENRIILYVDFKCTWHDTLIRKVFKY